MSQEEIKKHQTKGRSPSFPIVGLGQAVEMCRTIYTKEKLHPTERVLIAKALGYSGISGLSGRMVAALKYYGFLERVDSDNILKLSNIALSVIHPENEMEKKNALYVAAFSPVVFQELFDRYKDDLPSDETLCAILIRKNFSEDAAKDAIKAYKATLSFLNEQNVSISTQLKADLEKKEIAKEKAEEASNTFFNSIFPSTPPRAKESIPAALTSEEVLQYRLAANCTVRVLFDGAVTQKKIEKLIALLKLNADAYPEDDKLTSDHQQTATQPATSLTN